MTIYGDTKQEEEPTPENPKPIITETYIMIEGQKIPIKSDRKIKRIYQELGIWYIEFEFSVKEMIKKYNELMPKEKVIKWLKEMIKEDKEMLFSITYLNKTSKNENDFKFLNFNISDKNNLQKIINFIKNEEIGIKSIERLC